MKKLSSSLIVLAAVSAMAPYAVASEYPTKPFDALYTVTTPNGNAENRLICDGRGHLRSESKAFGTKSVTIIDYTARKQTTLIDQGMIAMQTKLPSVGNYVCDEASAKSAGAKSIGTKTLQGHTCHGWQYTNPAGKSEVWVADDAGCLVLSTTTGPAGKITTELKSLSKQGPTAEAFKVPANYKLQTM